MARLEGLRALRPDCGIVGGLSSRSEPLRRGAVVRHHEPAVDVVPLGDRLGRVAELFLWPRRVRGQ